MMISMLPKLTLEQRQWIEGLPEEAREMFEDELYQSGEEYVLQHWGWLHSQMEYVRTLL